MYNAKFYPGDEIPGTGTEKEEEPFTVINDNNTDETVTETHEEPPVQPGNGGGGLFNDEELIREQNNRGSMFGDSKPGEVKEEPQKVTGGRPNAHTEAKLMVNVLDIFFSRLFTLISGTSTTSKWKLGQEEKLELIGCATDWFLEEQIMSSKKFFLLAIVLIFVPLGGEAVLWRIKKNKLKKGNPNYILNEEEELRIEKPEDEIIVENIQRMDSSQIYERKRTNFEIDDYGFYVRDKYNKYIKVDDREEKAEWKDFAELVRANGRDRVNKYFKIAPSQ